jgi:hypothetical protein
LHKPSCALDAHLSSSACSCPFPQAQNPNLAALGADLASLHAAQLLDAFGLYLFGVVLKELGLAGPGDGRRPRVVSARARVKGIRAQHVF